MADLLEDGCPYFPLDKDSREIRLLILHPGTSGSQISFHLEATSFKHEKPMLEYEALSYEWGDSKHRKKIFIRNHPIEVRENLWYALDALRLPDESRFLWIDAICINQNDILERNHQVQQMADIYSQASRVLVWLGTATPQSRLAMSHLRKLSALVYNKRKPSVSQMVRSPQKWSALLDLLEKSYWSRVWIVQEIGLAKEIQVICGEDQSSWNIVQDLIQRLESMDPAVLPKAAVLVKSSLPAKLQKHRIAYEKGSCTLSGLLEDCAESLCTVPHDKIYGFLGLANDYRAKDFLIDYEKSTLELHADVILFQLRKRLAEEGDGWIPKWVPKPRPDLFEFGQLVFELLGCEFGTDYEAFNLAQSQSRVPLTASHILEYKINYGLTTVRALRPSSQDRESWLVSAGVVDSFPLNLAVEEYKYHEQAYRKNLDYHLEKLPSPSLHRLLHFSAPFSRIFLDGQEPHKGESFRILPSNLNIDEKPYPHYVQGVNFLGDGSLGVVPLGTRVGDYLYQIKNTDCVLVVRPDGQTNPIVGCAVIGGNFSRDLPRPTPSDFIFTPRTVPPPPAAVFWFDLQTFQLIHALKSSRYTEPIA